jgi:RNA polymerase sigma-70 factor
MKPAIPASTLARLYDRSDGARWGLSQGAFGEALHHVVGRHDVAAGDLDAFLDKLHLQDLALAVACRQGVERAWEHVIGEYRPVLRRAAAGIDPTGGAQELADALFGDLFGASEREGVRQSLLAHYHGRSSLATWLRAVLARRHVDRLRATQRLDPLPEDESQPTHAATNAQVGRELPRFRSAFRRALNAALHKLGARDRLRLACYYAQHLTLAQIGRLTGEHEATVSRQLTRVRRELKHEVADVLRTQEGFGAEALEEGFAAVVQDAGELDLSELLPQPRKVVRLVRSESSGGDS